MANINTAALAYLRNQVTNFLTDTCTIKSKSSGRSASYAPDNLYAVVASGVSCRVITGGQGSTTNAELLGERQIVGQQYEILLPYGQAVKAGYIIETGSEVYNVVTIETQLTDKAYVKVLAVKP